MKVEDVKKICVMGAGLMGNGIAQVCAQAGYEVTMRDIEDRFVENGLNTIKKNLSRGVTKGKMTQEQMNQVVNRIKGTTDLKAAAFNADVVIEAIIENRDLKRKVFEELDEICKPECIFASNTSSISITDMASATKRPEKFIGMHFFNPVPVMRLVEIIKGYDTSEETYEFIDELSKKLGKETVLVNEAPGFAVNRLLLPFLLEAIFTLQEGVTTVEDLDKAISLGLNHPMGPLTLLDFVGLDTALFIADYMYSEFQDSKYRAPTLLRKMVRAGHFGRKSGKGFYDYTKKPPEPHQFR
ncbi:MAG: 3-hydroxybutyryl-CoA dehydrogenase [Candidatus Heimdallarchaeota archaeon]|nr:MAG: 3-hydroxybutyryl-CoA dehydrogenase [Candidatus Heimdallarchaeota archaeon]